jgi:hypothetical protein
MATAAFYHRNAKDCITRFFKKRVEQGFREFFKDDGQFGNDQTISTAVSPFNKPESKD